MFLDEELLKIGRETELTKEEMLKAISEMVKSCFNNLQKSTNEKMTDNNIVANFKRVNNTWNRVAEILEKKIGDFLKKMVLNSLLKITLNLTEFSLNN